ncbi:MAG: hypothetical protein KDK96_06130 [Chlamydiia bacterium]|nr:hypothetical protein [Chlamydiia bacterium]
MAGKVDNSGSRWWSCFCCCRDDSDDEPDREKLKGTGETSDYSGQRKVIGSPQATYSHYRTNIESDPSPMK